MIQGLTLVGAQESVDQFFGTAPPDGSVARGVPWSEWIELGRTLNPEDVVLLAKGLYLISLRDHRWYGGSVTPMKALVSTLQTRGLLERVVEFAAWVGSQPRFLYFGEFEWAMVLGRDSSAWMVGTIEETRRRIQETRDDLARSESRLSEARELSRAKAQQQIQTEKLVWKGSARSRARAYAVQLLQQQLDQPERDSEVAAVRDLSPHERLERIAQRPDRTLMFWPAMWADVSDEALANLDSGTRVHLFLAARQVRRGKWKRLQRRLAEQGTLDWPLVVSDAQAQEGSPQLP